MPAHGGNRSEQNPRGYEPWAPQLPEEVLVRHQARMLVPAEADLVDGDDIPSPTAYRPASLLVPWDLLEPGRPGGARGDPAAGSDAAGAGQRYPDDRGEFLGLLDRVLDGMGLAYDPPPPLAEEFQQVLRRSGTRLARPIRLRRGPGAGPGRVDAWQALQALRFTAGGRPELERRIRRLSLEHLLIGSVWYGGTSGATNGHHAGDEDEFRRAPSGGRRPVAVLGGPPARRLQVRNSKLRRSKAGRSKVRRRAVVAVLDTGVGRHPWLERDSSDPFVLPDISTAGEYAGVHIPDPEDHGVVMDPLVGELDSHAGHGTFIAGIIRQVAPAARVLPVRVMHSDGVVTEADLQKALAMVRVRNFLAREQDRPQDFVDVLSLSMGYFPEDSVENQSRTELFHQLKQLVDDGVVVVASAGNSATSRPALPAAFSRPLNGKLLSVGALNPSSVGALSPNGIGGPAGPADGGLDPRRTSKANFSDDGAWVTVWAPGVEVVSTFPVTFQAGGSARTDTVVSTLSLPGSSGPELRSSLDPDDFRGGFGTWSGTSFAAPYIAAQAARALTGRSRIDRRSTRRRRKKVLAGLREEASRWR